MALTTLARERWKDFFDAVSRDVAAQTLSVEVTGLGLGDRMAADHVRLQGISFEPRDDTLTLFLQGLEHRMRHPRQIHIDATQGALTSFEVVDANGDHHIVQLHSALAMPAMT